jgi:hypothetical protein
LLLRVSPTPFFFFFFIFIFGEDVPQDTYGPDTSAVAAKGYMHRSAWHGERAETALSDQDTGRKAQAALAASTEAIDRLKFAFWRASIK